MNIFITQSLTATRFIALVTLFSLVLSALPASFFVAYAEGEVPADETAQQELETTTNGTDADNEDADSEAKDTNEIEKDKESTQPPAEIKEESKASGLTNAIMDLLPESLTGLFVASPTLEAAACTQTNVPGPTSIQNLNSSDYFNLVNEALADCDTDDGDVIELSANISITEQITINRPITLDGNGFTISPTFIRTGNENNSSIGIIETEDVVVKDLKIDGTAGTNLHGINVFVSTNVDIIDVEIKNPKRTGVVVNGSEVLVNNLKTSGSTWHAINVNPGSDVTTPSILEVKGVSVHGESVPTPHIFIDDISKNVTINDTNAQYEVVYLGPNPQKPSVIAKSLRLRTTPKLTETLVVSADTAVGVNQPGWVFNRDAANATPIAFNTAENVIGVGALNVLPISNTDAPRKFIGEYFYLDSIANLNKFSYDFKIGSGGTNSDSNQFYLNVYANFAATSPTNFYDCKYDVVPTNGTTGSFATVNFDPTQSYAVTTRGTSPHTCPSVPVNMNIQGAGATIRAFALNTGDTTLSDADLEGFFDKVVVDTNAKTTTFDFEPVKKTDQVKVHIYKYLQAGQVIAQVPNDSSAPSFPMISSWSAVNLGTGSGSYVLGKNEGGTALRYAADTSFMDAPADYTTSEVVGGDSVVIAPDAQCTPGKYRLVGYKQGDSLQDAESAVSSLTSPNFIDITTDKYVIVVNEKCGDITPVCAIGTNLIQNGSFEVENVTDHGATWEIFSTVANWVIGLSNGLEIWKNFNGTGAGLAADGINNAELDGDNATQITQTVTTTPGAQYELKYKYSARAGTVLADSAMETLVNGVTVATNNTDGSAATQNVWEAKNYAFTASGTSTSVSFKDVGPDNVDGGYGPLLDSVSLCKVAEAPVCKLSIVSDTNTLVEDSNTLAVATYSSHPSWTASIPVATWIWDTLQVVNPLADTTRTFVETFNIDTPTNASLTIAADNGYQVYLNGVLVKDEIGTEDNFHLAEQDVILLTLQSGANELKVVVKNFALANSDYTTNPAGLLFKLTAEGGKICERTTKPEEPKTTSTVKMCKFDNNQNPLSGWQLSLLGNKVTDLSVVPDGSTQSMTAVPVGNYVLKASGAYGYGNGGRSSDARFSDRDGVSPWVNTNTFAPAVVNYLSLQVNNDGAATWGSMFSPSHVYYGSLSQLSAGNVDFKILDDQYSDNSGSIKVDLYKGRTGVTGQDGCVTFADVAFGTYKVEELMQTGFTNVSGLGDVVVDKEEVIHNVVNTSTTIPPVKTSGPVTMCKVDEQQAPLSGWTLTLTGTESVANVVVPANSSAGVNTTASLSAGTSYVAFANGTWTNQNGVNPVDAEYSTTDSWVTRMDGYTGFQTDILELQINNTFDPNSNWGAYNSGHNYAQSFVPSVTGVTNFRIFDGSGTTVNSDWYPDNTGSLNVAVYKGFAGITGPNGCVTFSDVPFGEYTASEIMQDGWKEVSGDEPVTVSSSNNSFTIVNSKVPNEVGGGGNDGGTGGNNGTGGSSSRTPQGRVAGDSVTTIAPAGEVLGAQVTMMPAGAPNAGTGSTSNNMSLVLMLISLAGLAFSSMRTTNVEVKKS
jgi:hypothetical protein